MTSTDKPVSGHSTLADEARRYVPDFYDGEEGQSSAAGEAKPELPTSPSPNDGKGQVDAASAFGDMPNPSPKAGRGRCSSAEKARDHLRLPALIDALAELQVRRKFYISVVNKQTNAAKALVRRNLGWKYDEADADREKVNARAAHIVAAALAGKGQRPEDAEVAGTVISDLAVISAALEPCTNTRHNIELEMKRIVRSLPIYAWAKEVKGFGELGLAVVIAEAGNLSNYPAKGHLWKRLGLAPFEGKAYSTWRREGGLTAEDWTDAGYSPRRRAEIYAVISEPLFRAQTVAQGPYRAIYDRRRERTALAHPDWTKMHSHMDALRVMTKYLLRDLWQEWNGRKVSEAVPKRLGEPLPTVHLLAAE